jgi:hypothetical protein
MASSPALDGAQTPTELPQEVSVKFTLTTFLLAGIIVNNTTNSVDQM